MWGVSKVQARFTVASSAMTPAGLLRESEIRPVRVKGLSRRSASVEVEEKVKR